MGVRRTLTRNVVARMVVVTTILLGLGLLISSVLSPDGRVSRGNVPACQKACLSGHTKEIDNVIAQYQATHEKMEFQDRIEQAVARYRTCSDNCRVLFPIK